MNLPPILLQYRESVEGSLRSLFAQHSFSLYRLMEYQLGWRDEQAGPLDYPVENPRLYSALCLVASQAAGGDAGLAFPAATAMELVDNFFQVHADVQDGSQDRYGRPSVWWVWGPGQAINVGDAFHALARLSLMRQENEAAASERVLRAVQTLDAACLRACEGLHMDLVYQERVDITTEAYLSMVREKVGALVGCAFELGSQAAEAPPKTDEALREFGEELGVAARIGEDIRELWGEPGQGESEATDILNKKKSLPIVYALEKGPIGQRRALGNLFFKRVLEAADVPQIREILDTVGARAYSHEEVERLLDQAIRRLAESDISAEGRSDLERVARFLALHED